MKGERLGDSPRTDRRLGDSPRGGRRLQVRVAEVGVLEVDPEGNRNLEVGLAEESVLEVCLERLASRRFASKR